MSDWTQAKKARHFLGWSGKQGIWTAMDIGERLHILWKYPRGHDDATKEESKRNLSESFEFHVSRFSVFSYWF